MSDATAKTLADELSRLRSTAGLSYGQLAERSRLDKSYLYRLETGTKNRPSRDVIIQIGIGLGLDVDETNRLLRLSGHVPFFIQQN